MKTLLRMASRKIITWSVLKIKISPLCCAQCLWDGMRRGANALGRCPWRTAGAGVVDHADGGGRKEALRSIRPRSPVSRFLPRLEGPRLALWGHLAEMSSCSASALPNCCGSAAGALNPCALSSHQVFLRARRKTDCLVVCCAPRAGCRGN